MAYIGKTPTIGNFQKCDAISVVNGQAAYTLQVGGTNVVPESVNHMLVSLNGILQAPTDSFTVSGSTLTFASNLATGDVIDFVMILGNVLDLGVPSDNTVTTAKLGANAVTAAKLNNDIISGTTALATAPADTDEFLVSDAGTLKRIDYSLIKSDPTHVLLETQTISSGVAQVDFTSNIDSTYKAYMLEWINVHPGDDGQNFRVRFSIGGTFQTGTDYERMYARIHATSGAYEYSNSDNATFIIAGNDVGNEADEHLCGRFILYTPSDTTFTKLMRGDSIAVKSDGYPELFHFGGRLDTTSAVDGIRLYMGSGNIDSGLFKLYGIN